MVLALSACGGTATAGGGDAELKLIVTEYGDSSADSVKRYWKRLVDEFHTEHPGITVEVAVYPRGEADREVSKLVEAGKAPDLAQVSTYAEHAAAGRLYSAEQLLPIPRQADFVSRVANAGIASHRQYGMPFVASTRVLFYNKTLFEEAGVEEPPATWAELQSAALALKQSGVEIPYGLPLGPEEAEAETLNWVLSGGGGFTDTTGSYVLDGTENVRAFEWLRDELVGKGLTNPSPESTNRQDVYDRFVSGEIAMVNGHPALVEAARKAGVDFGMVPLPGRTGQSPATTGGADWMTAFKENGHRKEIGEFLDFVYSEKNMVEFAERYDLLPVTSSALAAMTEDNKDSSLSVFLGQLDSAQLHPVHKVSWQETARTIRNEIGQSVGPKGDPASVFALLQREAEMIENAG